MATRMRASGVRNSWDADASSVRCTETSDSMRAAARLKLAASAATSSQPSTSTLAPRSPAPRASARFLSRSSRRVIAHASGQAATAARTTRATKELDHEAARPPGHVGEKPSSVRQPERKDGTDVRAAPASALLRGPGWGRERRSRRCDQRHVGAVERKVDVELGGEPFEPARDACAVLRQRLRPAGDPARRSDRDADCRGCTRAIRPCRWLRTRGR